MRRIGAFIFALPLLLALAAPVRGTSLEPARPPALAALPALLDVPFLPQTEALCGGAAAAMVYRYWGDRHADVQQFAPLVERDRGGIAAARLVAAIATRGWSTGVESGSLASIGAHLAQREPVIVLIEDRPRRYHFVVVVGLSDAIVAVHDPTWGPARPMSVDRFLEAWQAAHTWSLVIRPATTGIPATPVHDSRPANDTIYRNAGSNRTTDSTTTDRCAAETDAAVDAIRAQGLQGARGAGSLDVADRLLGEVRRRCPTSSRPLSELAGVRFAQRRYADAATLAADAARLDDGDRYAWEVLGASRFLQNDVPAALAAWNAIGGPRLDTVRIDGLTRTRYSLVAQWLPLTPGTTLTTRDWRLAERRAALLPAAARATLRLTPQAPDAGADTSGGESAESVRWVDVTVSLLERDAAWRRPQVWVATALRAAVNRDIGLESRGWGGQGDLWSANWRWWPNRPRVDLAYAAPLIRRPGGVWRVEAAWTSQQFAPGREEQWHGGLARTDWLTPALRYDLRAGVDRWQAGGRYAQAGATFESRFAGDRLTLRAAIDRWSPMASAFSAFARGRVDATVRSSTSDRGAVSLGRLGIDAVSSAAPRLVWPLAGDTTAESPLLRAHLVGRRGSIDSAVFGRRLAHASLEQRQWFSRPALVRFGVAAFVDLARAWHTDADTGRSGLAAGSAGRTAGELAIDAGVGLRLRLPGQDGVLSADYARDLRTGNNVFSVAVRR